ncbi:nucleolar protein 8 isoform X2 [Embiotoca jacksoni]|uniref:nucleolar protein 8 isoform X2 n=1 Tax=Embiotoca jacksoni TaxID=100190 RepID=UPI00370386B2
MQRLYVGGLSHTITQKDLKDRFGKFGAVEDVELRTRRDEDGVPYKTFGYININISDADLKKCMTVLNKSKWKGGTLQIETAKESFLHRLAEERQATAEQRLRQPAVDDERQKLLDSLSKAGVDNFTMKAAVPGTEVPGHKDWVVSKFGRVLPVLQLRRQMGTKARTVNYDPSKYSHNIRRLDRQAADESTPVAQLTWEVQGGDDDISKKRRGEFPAYKPPRSKKSRPEVVDSSPAVSRTRSEPAVNSVNHSEPHQFTNGFKPATDHRAAQRKWTRATDSDVDSDEEIRRLVAVQQTSHGALQQEAEEDHLEVVGHDYLVKSRHKGDEDEDDYDSADTDELFASKKPPPPQPQKKKLPPSTAENKSGNNADRKRKTKKESKVREQEEEEEEEGSVDAEEQLASGKPSSKQQKADSSKRKQSKKVAVLPVINPSDSDSDIDDDDDGDEDDQEELESAGSCSDSDYEAMFSNVTRLEISLADLQMLAEFDQQTTAPSILSSGLPVRTPKKGTTPEEILAALMEEDSSDDEQEKKKKKKKRKGVVSTSLPAFQGTNTLGEGSETDKQQKRRKEEEEEEEEGEEVKKQKMNSEAPQLNHRATGSKTSQQKRIEAEKKTVECSEEEEEEEEEAVNPKKAETSSSSSSDDEEEERMKPSQTVHPAKSAAKASPSSRSSSEEDEGEQEMIPAVDTAPHGESSSGEEEDKMQAPPRVVLGAKEEEERQRKANMRRLAAVQQRQKEAEEHKKLIQGALANLDAPTAGAGKHIVFGSDDDDDEDGDGEDEQQAVSKLAKSKKSLSQHGQSEATGDEAAANQKAAVKEKGRLKASTPQLFDDSEDEEEGDEEKDGSRFDIRPEFEGRAGQKLMALQSRFGTDDRFRMDSRFLEEDEDEDKEEESETKRSLTEEDEALEEETRKSLSILQDVLGSSQPIKTAAKAKKFRDVSALHYDPSKEEHAAFETKTEDTKKESKSARRKKREEAQKLPDVSKELFYDVTGDLKAVFGQTKDDNTRGKDETNWDQVEEGEKEGEEEQTPLSSLFSADPGSEKEDSSGFKFSFFGDDPETGSGETEYKVESIQAPKVSWQQDPRFQDSSSEEDGDEQEEDEERSSSGVATKTPQQQTPAKTDFFFFFPDDSRLTEGPGMFCRVSQLEEQREQWEERRSALRQEYRKKHKDARRKLTSSLRS